ncbi:Conserved_hypothetical protein [Hexamita inflata]|uniref:Uncharacterized protein n=1 Tax=Hexamita inflata TaxID=28002 RepID=A0AA86NG69_9EUKA|nr:Conserved hypothetical protein [Hexamita inflata]
MPFMLTLGNDSEEQRRLQKLQQTRLNRIKEMRKIYSSAQHEMMQWYQQESKMQTNDLKNYNQQVKTAELQGKLLQKALEERAWDNVATANHVANIHHEKVLTDVQKKQQMTKLRNMSQKQRAEEAFDLINQKKLEEQKQLLLQKEKANQLHAKNETIRKQVIEAQKFRDNERKKYFLEEELYKNSLEYKTQQARNGTFVEVIKEDGIPLYVNKNKQRNVQILIDTEGENENGFAADAFHEAIIQQQNPNVKEYPVFNPSQTMMKNKISKLAEEGLSILDVIAKM